ncbi:MAG: pyocin large subunit-like protein, partial [Yoonia sp.]
MSWRIANECAERRFGSAARKQIIMFLADKASDDGSGIWCSKGTIQRHTELSESTVKRTIIDFLQEGILIETGRRHCKNGYTVIYRIALERVASMETTAEPDVLTGVTVNPVQPEPGTGSTVAGVRGSRWTPNHPKTIHKPPTRRR